jgi:hypothetical protein
MKSIKYFCLQLKHKVLLYTYIVIFDIGLWPWPLSHRANNWSIRNIIDIKPRTNNHWNPSRTFEYKRTQAIVDGRTTDKFGSQKLILSIMWQMSYLGNKYTVKLQMSSSLKPLGQFSTSSKWSLGKYQMLYRTGSYIQDQCHFWRSRFSI